MELFLDALLDALIDGVKMLPFLYLAYLLIEWPERIHGLFPPHTVYVDIRRGEKEEERIITVEQAE